LGNSLSTEAIPWFYPFRLHVVGMIKSSPNAILADGTDRRFLNELKRELKA
jgi:NitT/TauT family transport system substrate-binding protein